MAVLRMLLLANALVVIQKGPQADGFVLSHDRMVQAVECSNEIVVEWRAANGWKCALAVYVELTESVYAVSKKARSLRYV